MKKEPTTQPVLISRRDILAITAFLILILTVWIGISVLPSPGIVDLSGYDGFYDFSHVDFTDTVYAYNGDWFSYPGKLYTPEDFLSGRVTELPVLSNTLDYSEIQYFTHKMEISLPAGHTYGLFMRTADYSMRLFINGEEIDLVGQPGTSFDATTPRVLEKIYPFFPETDKTSNISRPFRSKTTAAARAGRNASRYCSPKQPGSRSRVALSSGDVKAYLVCSIF